MAGDEEDKDGFIRESEAPGRGFLCEFLAYLVQNRNWWLTPIIIVLLILSVLIYISVTGAAPFIYTVF